MDSTAPKPGPLRSPWLRGAVIVLVVGAWAWFLRGQVVELRQYPWQISTPAMLVAVLWGAAYFAGLGVCWTLLLRTMGGAATGVPIVVGTEIWLSTMLTRYIPGNIWHIVGRLAMAGRLGVSRTQVLASATVEQLLTLLGALAVFGLSVPFWRGGAGPERWLLLLVPAGLLLLHPQILGRGLAWAAHALSRPDLAWAYSFRTILTSLCTFVFANAAAGLALVIVLGGLAPLAADQIAFVIGAAALAWVIGYLSFLTPSGLGVREAALTALLSQICPLPVAIAGSLAYRLALTIGEIIAVACAVAYGRLLR
jgi:glycosyltransferase 2 family protein